MAIASKKRVIVIGGGLAGLSVTIKLAEEGVGVDLFSMVPVKRSHSVCAQGGINACNDIARQQGYSEWMHFDETALGGDFLADQPPVLEMCNWAPRIIDLLDRMGVPFNRTPEGQRSLRLFGGSLFKRTFFAGATTGQQLLYALDEQTRYWESEGRVEKHEFWEFLWPVIHTGPNGPSCVGIVAQDMRSMEIRAFKADAVVLATGGCGLVFGKSTMSVICTGGAASRCYQAGAIYGNPEFIQVHPTAIPGEDKCRLISESARGEGGRVWVPRKPGDSRAPNSIPESERFYFLEERYPKYGNLVPRDIATREIFQVCTELKLGVGGGNMVYLDLADTVKQIGREKVLGKLEGILEIYEKFVGTDPLDEPMKIFPAVHYSMGGLWCTFKKDQKTGGLKAGDPANMSTNIPGLYAMGEVSFAYHGANRLGANSLLSCIFDGLFGGTCIGNYCTDVSTADSAPQSAFDAVVKQETDRQNWLLGNKGDENPYLLWQEMGKWMTENCTVVRVNAKLQATLDQCQKWKERYQRVQLSDTGMWTNQNLSFARATRDMIVLAEAILRAALLRNESRGAHYKPEFPERDDANFLKATLATYDAATGTPKIEFGPVDTSLVVPRARTYGKKG
jgi:succinate dehydrogenase / fumarate reductase flavoprotein subunit